MGKTPKDFISGSENILKNITTEIVRLCVQQNVVVKPEVVSLTVSLLCLNPQHGLILDSHADREVVESFVKKCVDIFLENDCPLIKTLHLQALFMGKSLDMEEIRNIYEERLNTKTELIVQDILNFEISEPGDQEILFHKIVVDIIVNNKLGRPNNAQVVLETSNALKSVFSRADILEFTTSKRRKRMETLINLRQLVCGIRLFNKDAGHCSEGVRDIISDVSLGLKNTKTALTDALSESNKHVNSIVESLKRLFTHEEDLLKFVEEEDLNSLKDSLILNTQHQEFTSSLLNALNRFKKDIEKLFENFKATLDALHEALKYRIAVATEKVFPHFMSLSKIWNALMTYLYVFVELNTLNDEMGNIVGSGKYLDEILYYISKIPRNIQRKTVYPDTIKVTHPECEIVNTTKDISLKPFHRFCAYLFIHGNGILIPAQQHLGFLRYRNYYFAFSEIEYINIFSKNIEKSVSKFLDTVRSNPQTIVFFDLFDEVLNLHTEEEEIEQEAEVKKANVETQTELHPISFRKDKDYTWNIWDLRRKAIQLANIKKCTTHSVQTEISYHRQCSRSQTFDPREKSNQTMRTTSLNTVKEKNYQVGKILKSLPCAASATEFKNISTITDSEPSCSGDFTL